MTPETPDQQLARIRDAVTAPAHAGDARAYAPAGACPLCRSFTGHTDGCPVVYSAARVHKTAIRDQLDDARRGKKAPPRRLRFHYPDGRRITVTPAQLATENATTVRGALDLIDTWLAAGDLRRRTDGGYDVIRYRPPRAPRNRP